MRSCVIFAAWWRKAQVVIQADFPRSQLTCDRGLSHGEHIDIKRNGLSFVDDIEMHFLLKEKVFILIQISLDSIFIQISLISF